MENILKPDKGAIVFLTFAWHFSALSIVQQIGKEGLPKCSPPQVKEKNINKSKGVIPPRLFSCHDSSRLSNYEGAISNYEGMVIWRVIIEKGPLPPPGLLCPPPPPLEAFLKEIIDFHCPEAFS